MSNVSAVTNHFPTANEGFITTLGGSILASAATVPLTSVSGLTNGTIFVGIIEPGQAKQQTFTGVVDTAGVQITGVKWTRGTDVDHTAGVTIVDYVSGTGNNMITKGILKHANQDGTLKAGAVDNTAVIGSGVVEQTNLREKASEYQADFVASGGVVAQTAGLTGSFSDITYYISGVRYTKTGVANKTYTASKDTYVDINGAGTVTYVEVANGAASPSLAAGYIRVAKVVTSGSAITGITQYGSDSLSNPIYPLAPADNQNVSLLAPIPAKIVYTPSSNFGSTEVNVQSWSITVPTGCTRMLVFASARYQSQSASTTDISGTVDYGEGEAATVSYPGYQRGASRVITTVGTFNGATITFVDEFVVVPGVHTMRILGVTNGPLANASNFYMKCIPLAG